MNAGLFSRSFHYRWIAVLWTIGIVIGCSIPPSTLSPVDPVVSFDKLVHFGLFAVFGVLWMRGFCPPQGRARRHLWTRGGYLFLAGVLFAVATEVYQEFLPITRMADPYDALADSAGVAAGIVAYVTYAQYAKPSR